MRPRRPAHISLRSAEGCSGLKRQPELGTSLNRERLEDSRRKDLTTMPEPREYTEFPSHTVSYEIMTNVDEEDKERSYTVLATPQEIEQLAEQG